jgi:hypothetical protein
MNTPNPNTYWVTPGRFLAGEYPGAWYEADARERLCRYLDVGITYFLDLTDPADGLEPYAPLLKAEAAARRIVVVHKPMTIRDMDIPTVTHMTDILNTLDLALSDGHNVYVHCWGGIGRTGTVVGCYLARHGQTGISALNHLAQLWRGVAKSRMYPRSPQTEAQVEFVLRWSEDKVRDLGIRD